MGGHAFVLATLLSEAAILFVAAQTGFLDGPRVLANMALDRWFPTRFAMLSDRLVTQKGILLMGGSAIVLMLITRGSVDLLIVLYSINVFITFCLSQLGMVRHWLAARGREPHWRKGLILNGLGLALCAFILATVTAIKFFEGGWATLLVTGAVAALAMTIRRHYDATWAMLKRLDAAHPRGRGRRHAAGGSAGGRNGLRRRRQDRRDPGQRLQRPGHAHPARHPAHVRRRVPEPHLRPGGHGRRRRVQGRGGDGGAQDALSAATWTAT